jgi:hypothetical protein
MEKSTKPASAMGPQEWSPGRCGSTRSTRAGSRPGHGSMPWGEHVTDEEYRHADTYRIQS